ncbi:hypothetical protein [cyanobacterium endosymbiont of Rhopalodia gibberula]|uniref:hypothetical protein n=1 Tax=cyanobacterium endosymbiont of Rhopalodia gibberula TaxID=1763363 RepID=UPI003B8373F9
MSVNATAIIKEAVVKSLLHFDVTNPGVNIHNIHHYTACFRTLDYYLRYSTYTMLAGNFFILDELVLNSLKRTCNSLNILITSTIQAI